VAVCIPPAWGSRNLRSGIRKQHYIVERNETGSQEFKILTGYARQRTSPGKQLRGYFNSVIIPGTLHRWNRLSGAHL
jgi:phage head maturation protease